MPVVHRGAGGNRRLAAPTWLTAVLGATLVALALIPPAPARAQVPLINAQVGGSPVGSPLPAGFTGISFEYPALHSYTGRDPGAINPVLVGLLRGLVPGQAPVLRIGGDSTDATWWPVPGMIAPAGINYRLTPGWMRTTQALAAQLGAKLIMGVNLAANRPALAAAEARAIIHGIGRGYLDALEIGNEPDLYGVIPWFRDLAHHVVLARSKRYSLRALTREFSRWRAAMPAAPLAGPTLSSLSWMGGLGSFIAAQRSLTMVTFHRYPLRACINNPSDPSFASIPSLLSDTAAAGLAYGIAPYVQVAHAAGLPFRLDELNSASCRGRAGVSDTFSSALWLLDTLFNMAAVGVDGVNLHTLPGAAYEPFTFTHDSSGWHAFVHPLYYGALMFGRAFPPGARLLPVSSAPGPLKVWATRDVRGHTRVMLINKQAATPVTVNLAVAGTKGPGLTQALVAPSLQSTNNVTLGGQGFGDRTDTGTLPGQPSGPLLTPVLGGSYAVEVPAASAVLVTF